MRQSRRFGRGRVATGAALVVALGAAGCAHQDEGLVPAPQASVVPGEPRLAYDTQGDVELWVDGDAWRAQPRDLEEVMTPIWVTVRNRGQRPVRLMYKDFGLQYPGGVRVNPLPPFSMRTEGPLRHSEVLVPRFRYSGFFLAPTYGRFYRGLRTWYRPLPYDPWFYDTYYARWRVNLPTTDMLSSALPEGVLEPGGSVSGFLYFPDLPEDARGVFTFRAELAEGADGQTVASLDVPLVVK
jgi:hypothetical protein